jgi:hypothetical protein
MKLNKKKHIINRTVQCLALLGSAGLCLPVFAQDSETIETGEPVAAGQQANQKLPVTFDIGGSYQAKTDIDSGGQFSLARFKTGLGVPITLNDQFVLATSVKYDLASYDFSDGAGTPWTSINTFTAVALLQYKLDDKWTIYGGPIVRVSAEANGDFSKAWTGGGAAAFNYRVNDTLSLGAGIVAISQIEDDAMVLPIITANWRFADEWRLIVGFSDLAAAGYGAQVTYDVGDFWQLAFGGQFHKSRFRIDNQNAIGQDQAFTLSASATYKFTEALAGTAYVGMATGGQLRLEDQNGNKLGDTDYDAAPIFGLKATVKF